MLELLKSRHSVRGYLDKPLSEDVKDKLRAEVTMINTHEAGLNFQLCFDDNEPFAGFNRSYGMFKNARNYLAAVIDSTFPHAEERAGYFAEQFVMECVKLGLGSCFVSGTYSPRHVNVNMEVYEKLPFIVVFGLKGDRESRMAGFMSKLVHRGGEDDNPRDFFQGSDSEYKEAKRLYPKLDDGLQGVACAPSAMNARGVRITLEDGRLKAVFAKGHNLTDMGIAVYNFEAASGYQVDF